MYNERESSPQKKISLHVCCIQCNLIFFLFHARENRGKNSEGRNPLLRIFFYLVFFFLVYIFLYYKGKSGLGRVVWHFSNLAINCYILVWLHNLKYNFNHVNWWKLIISLSSNISTLPEASCKLTRKYCKMEILMEHKIRSWWKIVYVRRPPRLFFRLFRYNDEFIQFQCGCFLSLPLDCERGSFYYFFFTRREKKWNEICIQRMGKKMLNLQKKNRGTPYTSMCIFLLPFSSVGGKCRSLFLFGKILKMKNWFVYAFPQENFFYDNTQTSFGIFRKMCVAYCPVP